MARSPSAILKGGGKATKKASKAKDLKVELKTAQKEEKAAFKEWNAASLRLFKIERKLDKLTEKKDDKARSGAKTEVVSTQTVVDADVRAEDARVEPLGYGTQSAEAQSDVPPLVLQNDPQTV